MRLGAVCRWTPLLLGCLSAGAGDRQALVAQEVRRLTHDEWVDHHPVFSPSGDRILFTSRDHRETGMFLIPVGGGERKRIPIPTDVQGDFYTDWSPDGRSIVFDRRVGDGPGDIYLLRLGSGEMERLTDYPGMDGQPSFSPGGDRVVFTSLRGGSLDIWTMDVHGGGMVRLTDDPEADFHPRWSPDGTRILFTSRRGGDQHIWVMDADGRNQRSLTSLPGIEDRGYWSPDGSRIVFNRNDDLWLIDADGGSPERLTSFPGREGNACWSRDGRLIAFVSDRSGSVDLWVLTLSGDGVPRGAGGDRRLRPVLGAGHVAGGGAGRAPAHDSLHLGETIPWTSWKPFGPVAP